MNTFQIMADIAVVLREEGPSYLTHAIPRGLFMKCLPKESTRAKRLLRATVAPAWISYLRYSLRKSWDSLVIFPAKRLPKADFLVYATTVNQMDAMKGAVDHLVAKGFSVHCASGDAAVLSRDPRYQAMPTSIRDLLLPLVFRLLKFRFFNKLHNGEKNGREGKFECYRSIYGLSRAASTIDRLRPKVLLISNDHSFPHRCMLAMAHVNRVKTVYLQHASVSKVFPRLNFDIAFLDGRVAADTYAACSRNYPSTEVGEPVLRRKPLVLLSGQKKLLGVSRQRSNRSLPVGVAVSANDNLQAVIETVIHLVRGGLKARLRWHPRQSQGDQSILADFSKQHPDSISISDPLQESQDVFFGACCCVIAGNCSILLEAAISGLAVFQCDFNEDQPHDYYGYISKGIAVYCRSPYEAFVRVQLAIQGKAKPCLLKLKDFSETLGTPWQGHEGALVAETLARLAVGKSIEDLYQRSLKCDTGVFVGVFGLPDGKGASPFVPGETTEPRSEPDQASSHQGNHTVC